MEQTTDEELLRAYNSGDSTAFEALFHRHKDKIFNFAQRLLGNRPDAEDITSEVFAMLCQKRFTDDGRAKLTTWLFTVARNACMSRLRSVKHTVSLWFKNDTDNDVQWDVPDTRPGPRDAMGNKDTERLVRKSLGKLPLEQKEALILREYFHKDYMEIASILNCSTDKVKVLIFRGREALRKDLHEVLKEEDS